MKKQTKKTTWLKATPVSFNMQLGFILVMIVFMSMGLISLLMSALLYRVYISGATLAYHLVSEAFPLLLLVSAYLLAPKYKNVVNRLFVAMLYTAIGFIGFTASSFIAQVVLLHLTGQLGTVWGGTGVQFALMAAVWLGFTGFLMYKNAPLLKR